MGELHIFLENLYAVHSLQYQKLEHHFYVFAVRKGERWLSWEEVKFYAAMLELPTVPEIEMEPTPFDKAAFERKLQNVVMGPGALEGTRGGVPGTGLNGQDSLIPNDCFPLRW